MFPLLQVTTAGPLIIKIKEYLQRILPISLDLRMFFQNTETSSGNTDIAMITVFLLSRMQLIK